MAKLYSVGELTKHFRQRHHAHALEQWHVLRVLRTLTIVVQRVGRWRVFDAGDLPIIEAALVEAGYLRKPKQ